MNVHTPNRPGLPEREATPEPVFLDRRRVVQGLGLGSLLIGTSGAGAVFGETSHDSTRPAIGKRHADRFQNVRQTDYTAGTERSVTPEGVSSTHNNFYEFTTAKDKVWELARDYRVDSWKIEVHGLVEKPRTLDLDDLFTAFPLEERIYRFRCVERWAMQVPWVGYPLRELLKSLKPLSSAKYVAFKSFSDPKGLPGQRKATWYPWPYFECLRLDEAMHELAFVVVGSYGHALPMQHGAPWRLALPWKYGYKSPKSIVEIEFTAERRGTFWNDFQPEEYGFYSNVEPHKPHPRWSQRWETDIGTGKERPTLLYNGYEKEVGSLYDGREI